MADMDDFKQFTISSKKSEIDGKKVYESAYYDRDNKAFERAVKSAVSKEAQIYFGNKSISKGGKEQVDIFIHSSNPADVPNARRALRQMEGTLPRDYAVTSKKELDTEQLASLLKEDKRSGEARSEQHSIKTLLSLSRMIASLAGLTNIVRRILSAVLTMSAQSVKEATTAHGLGLSYDTVRRFDLIETRSGMESGSMTGAVNDLQTKFGNVTTLDTGALDALAVVMGSGIKELALTGVDPTRTEDLLADILNAFNTRAEQGVNSIGQYVGTDDARKELFSYLNKISPAVAGIFNKMQEQDNNVNSIYRGKFDVTDYESWKRALLTNTIDFTPAQRGLEQTLGEYKNSIDSLIKQLKERITVSVAPELIAILRKISDIRWGQSASENANTNKTNYEDNQAYITELENGLAMLPESEEGLSKADAKRLRALKSYYNSEIAKAKKENAKYAEGKKVSPVRTTDNLEIANVSKVFRLANNLETQISEKNEIDELEDALSRAGTSQEDINKAIDKEIDNTIGSKKDRIKAKKEEKKRELAERYKNEKAQATAEVTASWDITTQGGAIPTNTVYMNAIAQKLHDAYGWNLDKTITGRLVAKEPEAWKSISNKQIEAEVEQEMTDERARLEQDENFIRNLLIQLVRKNGLASQMYYKVMPEEKSADDAQSKWFAYKHYDAEAMMQALIKAGEGAVAQVHGNTTDSEGGKHFTLTFKIVDDKGNTKGEYTMFEGSEMSLESGLYDTFTYNASTGRLERVNASGTVAK
jgi:hypothetical protein